MRSEEASGESPAAGFEYHGGTAFAKNFFHAGSVRDGIEVFRDDHYGPEAVFRDGGTEYEHLERDAVVRQERYGGRFAVGQFLVESVVWLRVEAGLADACGGAHDIGRDWLAFAFQSAGLVADDVVHGALARKIKHGAIGRHEVLRFAG